MRVYLPATLPLLMQWHAAGSAPAVDHAFAVTPALREWYRDGDANELEHVAQVAAGRAALELLAVDRAAPRQRVVVAADAPDQALRPAPAAGRAAVAVGAEVPLVDWACVLVDEAEAAATVTAAVAALAAAAADDDARFALDEADATELSWYAVQEIPHLLD